MASYALYAALIIYCLFSSPTPDELGWAEYLIAILIIASIGLVRGWNTITKSDYVIPLSYHRFFLLYMMSVPLIIAAISGYSVTDILRDVIPLAFLVLPLCFYNKDIKQFDILLMVMGAIFGARYLLPLLPYGFGETDFLLYLANSPLLPFSAIIGFHYFSNPDKSLIIIRFLGLACCALTLFAMAAMLQRAPFILSMLGCMGLLAIRSSYRPITSIAIGAAIMTALIFIFPFLFDVIESLTEKTINVGWNNRLNEWSAVLFHTTLLGHGWGSLWQSPAVADIWVRYTHNMLSYYWLKAGIVGGLLSAVFIVLWGWHILKYVRINPAIGIAILVPFTIHVTLYAGFKSLDFALLLTLASMRCLPVKNQS